MTRTQRLWQRREIARTWLGRPGAVQQLGRLIEGRAIAHRTNDRKRRGLPAVRIEGPLTVRVESLVHDIVVHGRRGRWFSVTCAICIMAELVFASESASVGFGDESALPPAVARRVLPLRLLRNAVMHPAAWTTEGRNPPFVEQLVVWLRKESEGRIASEIERDWSYLGHARVARLALGHLDDAVTKYAERVLRVVL